MSNHHFLVVSLPYPVHIPIKQMLYRSKTLQLPHFFLDLRPPSAQSWALSFDKRSSRVDCANHMGFKETSFKCFFKDHLTCSRYMAVCQNLVPLVNIKIAGKWMFIPLKMVFIGIDPYPYDCQNCGKRKHIACQQCLDPGILLGHTKSQHNICVYQACPRMF